MYTCTCTLPIPQDSQDKKMGKQVSKKKSK